MGRSEESTTCLWSLDLVDFNLNSRRSSLDGEEDKEVEWIIGLAFGPSLGKGGVGYCCFQWSRTFYSVFKYLKRVMT